MTKPKSKIKLVKFTPAEMSYNGPSPGELRKWKPVGRGKDAIFRKPASAARPTVVLDADVAAVFADPKIVNEALRGLINLARQSTQPNPKRRKTA
jgi:hypothetical protein